MLEVDRAELGMADEIRVACFQLVERIVRGEWDRSAFSSAGLPQHAAETERCDARRAEFQETPSTNSFVLAIRAHDRSPLCPALGACRFHIED